MGNVGSDARTPDDFSVKARLECHWWCGDPSHRWFSAPPHQHDVRFSGPQCHQERIDSDRRSLNTSVADHPKLVDAWADPRPYDGLVVDDLCGGVDGQNRGLTYALRCPQGHKLDTVARSYFFAGCPWCRGNETRSIPPKSLADVDPEVSLTWHPSRNGEKTPENTPSSYRKPLWWQSRQCCGYEWEEALPERILRRRPQAGRGHWFCPNCESVFGSLAWLDPALASEWHEDNDLTPWHVKPFSGNVVVKWRCGADPSHEWEAAVADRSAGRLCPHCSTAGTSKVEQDFLATTQRHHADASPARVGRWRIDILVPGLRLAVEYDGSYWHGEKSALDERKTLELLDAGYLVARIRENDLPHLDLDHPRLRQVSFWPSAGDRESLVADLLAWAQEAQ